MTMKKRHKSTIARAKHIKALTALHYEAGNQAKCYRAVWRHYIKPEYGICYRTYLTYLGIDPDTDPDYRQDVQPTLFG